MASTAPTRPEVRIAERAGFCYGVRLAIDKAKHAREAGKDVTTLGQLVHNPGIKADLSDRGIRTADLADQVEGGTLVDPRPRGAARPSSRSVSRQARRPRGHRRHLHLGAPEPEGGRASSAEAGYTVCIIGHEDHPEVKGVRSYAGDNHVVVDDMDRSTWERVPHTKKIGVLSQSTILPLQAGGVRRLLPAPLPRPAGREHRLPGDAHPPGRHGDAGARGRRDDRGRRQEQLATPRSWR